MPDKPQREPASSRSQTEDYRGQGAVGSEPAEALPGGRQRGRFTILKPHAQGGLGQVSLARDEKLLRQVALKEIRLDRQASPSLRQRFVAEAQITGQLEHPGVVPIYAFDEDTDGRPYYAMRFIEGHTLAHAIRAYHSAPQPLAFRELLQRFVTVCRTIAYAHSRGVIHRDLKPANVMLGEYGETLVVDWGLAKCVQQTEREAPNQGPTVNADTSALETPHSELTEAGQVLGTPAYMAPEQAAGEPAGPAADIYALGAMLYELLTDRPPYHGSSLDVLRQVQQGLPLPPHQRRMGVPAPLEAVCRKAMARTIAERYATATELAEEISRWLADEPVSACREPLLVRASRWVRRHRQLMTGAAALLLAAVPLSLLLAVNREQARRQAETDKREIAKQKTTAEINEKTAVERDAETRAVLEFVENKIFAAARPEGQEGGLGNQVKLRNAVAAALPYVNESFTNQPVIEARLRLTLGASFWYLGDTKTAAQQEEIALRLYTQHRGPDHLDTVMSMSKLGLSYTALGRHADAFGLFEKTLALRQAKLGPDHPDTLRSMNNLSLSYSSLGRHADALKLREQTLALQKAKLGLDHPDTLITMNNLASTYDRLGRHTDSLGLFEETLALRKAKLGPDHPDTLRSMSNLAINYAVLGRHADALKLREQTLALQKIKLDPDHPDTLRTMSGLGNSYAALGRHVEALGLREQTLALRKAKLGPDHADTLRSMSNLAESYAALDRHNDALKLLQETLARQAARLSPDHPDTLNSMHHLAVSYAALGRHADALKLREETLALRKAKLGPEHPDTLASMGALAETLVRLERGVEAVPIIDECFNRAQGKVVDRRLIPSVVDLRLRHFARLKDAAACRTTAAMWEKLKRTDVASLYDAACMRAVTAKVIKQDAKTPAADGDRLAKEEADRAMSWLQQAVAAGYNNVAQMRKDVDLDALRERDDFKQLIAELEAKKK